MSKLIVEISDELHRELKREAISSDETIKEVITRLIDQYLAGRKRKMTAPGKSGFCGAWRDERGADQIISEIKSSRRWVEREKKFA